VAQKPAARIGAATGMGVAAADHFEHDDTLENATVDPTSQLPQLSLHDETDIDLGYQDDLSFKEENAFDNNDDVGFDLGEQDLTESGDHTLDTTRVEVIDEADTLEYSGAGYSDELDIDARSVTHSDEDDFLDDEPIQAYEEFHEEPDFNVDDTGSSTLEDHTGIGRELDADASREFSADRYDKNFDSDDDDDDWVDISLGD